MHHCAFVPKPPRLIKSSHPRTRRLQIQEVETETKPPRFPIPIPISRYVAGYVLVSYLVWYIWKLESAFPLETTCKVGSPRLAQLKPSSLDTYIKTKYIPT